MFKNLIFVKIFPAIPAETPLIEPGEIALET